MGRARRTYTHLPLRVYWDGKRFNYHPKPLMVDGVLVRQKRIPLGTTDAEMWRNWHQLQVDPTAFIHTMGQLFDAYQREVLPKKHPGTARDEQQSLKFLRIGLSDIVLTDFRPHHCYEYLDARTAVTRANRELACLSNVFKLAIRKGLIHRNPTHKVERKKEKPRKRNPETWELAVMMDYGAPLLAAYIPIKVLTGLRQGDILRMLKSKILAPVGDVVPPRGDTDTITGQDAIEVHTGKTGDDYFITWSHELRLAVANAYAYAAASKVTGMYLFTVRQGKRRGSHYTGDGFRTLWHKAMKKALAAGALKEGFHEHDIRAHTATEAKERAQELLQHKDRRTTAIYIRNKERKRVAPLR